jgi:hypothetical protein
MPEPMTYRDCHYDEERHVLLIACSIDKFAEDRTSRTSAITLLHLNGNFGCDRLDGMRVCSVTRNPFATWVIGDHGEVWTSPRDPSKPETQEQLPDSGPRTGRHLGSPTRIRLIGGRPYVCGFAGQIYTLEGSTWVHMDDGIVEPEGNANSLDLEGIHGTGPDNIYVVGSEGFLARWNGKTWTRIKLMTNSYLAGVRAFARDHVVAVGNNGTIIEWAGEGWTVDTIPRQGILSDVERFDGKLYVASAGKLLVRNGKTWDEIRVPRLKERPEAIRLAVGDGRLWVMGSKRVHSYDGTWRVHIDPDNG